MIESGSFNEEALEVYVKWCEQEEKKVTNSKETLELEISKAKLLVECRCYSQAVDILEPIIRGVGEDVDKYPELADTVWDLWDQLDLQI